MRRVHLTFTRVRAATMSERGATQSSYPAIRSCDPDDPRSAGRASLRLRKADHAEAEDLALPLLRREGPLHAQRGAPGREELPSLWDARPSTRVAREAVRPHADPPLEARRDGEEARAAEVTRSIRPEHRPAGQAVVPVLPHGGAAFSAFSAHRGLRRLDHHELGRRELVPLGLPHEEEVVVPGPRLQFQERELARGNHLVHPADEVAGVLEPYDLLILAQAQPRLAEAQLLVEPREVRHLDGELEGAQAQVHVGEELVRVEVRRRSEA